MVTVLRPDEVKAKYGPMFCQGLYTIVDEKTGKVRIIEKCSAHGPAEWDVVNRRRTGGVIDKADLEGTSIIMEVSLGEKELNFGPASAELGGQGIRACRIEGNEVRTTWYGIAGASVGVGACLPACKDVFRTENILACGKACPDAHGIAGASVGTPLTWTSSPPNWSV